MSSMSDLGECHLRAAGLTRELTKTYTSVARELVK
jgi:hypothetical protein